MRQVHVHRRVGAGVIEQLTDGGVERRVDLAERVTPEGASFFGVVPRMVLVVDLPELVARAVRLAEHGEEQVPVTLVQEVARERGLLLHTVQDLGEQRLVLRDRAVVARAVRDVARRVVRERCGARPGQVRAVLRVDVVQQRRRERLRSGVAVVTSPLHDLNAVQLGRDRGVGRVDDGDVTARVGDPLPNRGLGAVARAVRPDPGRLVRATADLTRAQELVVRR